MTLIPASGGPTGSTGCPLLFEIESPTDVVGPLQQFQSASLDKEGVLRVFKSINDAQEADRRLEEQQLGRAFGKFWPDFEKHWLAKVPATDDETPVERSNRDLLEECLIHLRQLPLQLSVPSRDVIHDFRMRVSEFNSRGFDLNRGRALGGQIHEYFLQFAGDEANITHYDSLNVLGGQLMRATSCDEAIVALDALDQEFDALLSPPDYYGSGSAYS